MVHRNGWKTPLWVMAGLLAFWTIPAMVYDILHLCPVRPDGTSQAQALPNWGRKYGMDCSVCHTTIPRLNRAGYLFRRAGFRMPDEYGADAKFDNLKDVASVFVRENYEIQDVKGGASPMSSNRFAFQGVTLHPLNGAFGKWWSGRTEMEFESGEEPAVESAYGRATAFHKDWVFYGRAGIFHPIEGYGASDEPLSSFRPLYQESSAQRGSFNTLVTLAEQNQEGAEVGLGWKDSTLSVAVVNGFNVSRAAANKGDDNSRKDVRLFFNQLIGDKGGISAEYLRGVTQFDSVPNPGTNWFNRYWRSAVYANYQVLKEKLNFLTGFATGRDHFEDSTTGDTSGTFTNNGWFAEVESKLHERFTGSVRYDTFKPDRGGNDNRLSAVTVTGVVPFEHTRFMVDYRRKTTEQAAPTDKEVDNTVLAQWMLLF